MKSKRLWVLATCFGFALVSWNPVMAQPTMVCRTARIQFKASTPLEKITATNNNGLALLDPASGKLEIVVLLKSFQFPNALMQDHFNDNYVESDRFPKAKFQGQLVDLPFKWFLQDQWDGWAVGTLELHGKSQVVKIPVQLNKQKNNWSGQAQFVLQPEQYDIVIPALVRDKIAKAVDIQVQVLFPLLK